jgi:predicted Rossmann-fold nucleotide-binding protein
MGLMGTISNVVLDAGGKTIGVIPRAMITAEGEGENIISHMELVADNV